MINKKRRQILKEIKNLLKEGFSDTDPVQIGINLSKNSSSVYNGFSVLIAQGTGVFGTGDNVTENELRDYVEYNKTKPNANPIANQKICADGLVVVDGEGRFVDSLMFVMCSGKEPYKVIRGPAVPRNTLIPNAIQDFINKGFLKSKIAQKTTPQEQPTKCKDGSQPTINFAQPGTMVCADGTVIKTVEPSPTPAPAPGPAPAVAQTGKAFRCSNKEDVAVFQQYLGIKVDCSIGTGTMTAAAQKGTKTNLQDLQTPQAQTVFCNSLKTNRASYEAEIKKANPKAVIAKCPSGGGARRPGTGGVGQTIYTAAYVDGLQSKPAVNLANQTIKYRRGNNLYTVKIGPDGKPIPGTMGMVQAESKNFYDNKKLIESKILFNKLVNEIKEVK